MGIMSARPLVIIPARAGSRGIPNKNFRRLPDGSTCVGRAIAIARQLQPAQIIVSTDKAHWRAPEGVIKRLRNATLATDEARMAEVVADVLHAYPGPADQAVVLLQPTVPLRTVAVVRRCLRHVPPCATMSLLPAKYWRAVRVDCWATLPGRRQDSARMGLFTGDAYVFDRRLSCPELCADAWRPVLVPESINLDTTQDWVRVCQALGKPTR